MTHAGFTTEVMEVLSEMKVFIHERMATKEDLEKMGAKTDIEFQAVRDELGRMATKEDLAATNAEIQSMRAQMATKEDLECMATKEDLECMATKEDLECMATKEDLESTHLEIMVFLKEYMVTKDEFRSVLNRELHDLKWDILDQTDKKIANVKGDLVSMIRQESEGATALVGKLYEKDILSQVERQHLLALQPFPNERV